MSFIDKILFFYEIRDWENIELYVSDNYTDIYNSIYNSIDNDDNIVILLKIFIYLIQYSNDEFLKISLRHDYREKIIDDINYLPLTMDKYSIKEEKCMICMDEYLLDDNDSINIIKCKKCNKILGHFTCFDKWLQHSNFICCNEQIGYLSFQ